MKKLNESTTSGSVAGYSKPVSTPIKRIIYKGCASCEALSKLQGTRIICGTCGRKK